MCGTTGDTMWSSIWVTLPEFDISLEVYGRICITLCLVYHCLSLVFNCSRELSVYFRYKEFEWSSGLCFSVVIRNSNFPKREGRHIRGKLIKPNLVHKNCACKCFILWGLFYFWSVDIGYEKDILRFLSFCSIWVFFSVLLDKHISFFPFHPTLSNTRQSLASK